MRGDHMKKRVYRTDAQKAAIIEAYASAKNGQRAALLKREGIKQNAIHNWRWALGLTKSGNAVSVPVVKRAAKESTRKPRPETLEQTVKRMTLDFMASALELQARQIREGA